MYHVLAVPFFIYPLWVLANSGRLLTKRALCSKKAAMLVDTHTDDRRFVIAARRKRTSLDAACQPVTMPVTDIEAVAIKPVGTDVAHNHLDEWFVVFAQAAIRKLTYFQWRKDIAADIYETLAVSDHDRIVVGKDVCRSIST